jgi:UDPglucose--hexose-1-phosphate uridylyltransferase
MISIPVIPPDVEHSLAGSTDYFRKNKKCVHCSMIDWEKFDRKRIIFENDDAIAFAPFVSKEPFEFRIFPKKHLPYFEDTPKKDLVSVAMALKASLAMLEKKMPGIDYNFFIHTAPVKNKAKYGHYHWHLEVQPKISTAGGFELGTGIEITVVDPEEAAAFIRGDKKGGK